MMMNDAELYQSSNIWQKRDVFLCLKEYGAMIKWKDSGEKLIDIGCGDGSVTSEILKKFIPTNYKKIVGCDISEEMIKFAKQKYSSNNIEFIVLNIVEEMPYNLQNSFDHAVSMFTLHRIQQQETAFTNIYQLLADGGACWLMYFGYNSIYDVYRTLARSDRWRYWLKDIEHYVTPYQDSQNPESKIKEMMQKIGFTNVKVNTKYSSFTYTSMDMFKKSMAAVDLFSIPKELINTFTEDMVDVMRDMGDVKETDSNENDLVNLSFRYSMLIITGNKSV